jgi:hypothetical protein
MKTSRIIWGFASLLLLITIAVSSGSFPSLGQERTIKKHSDATPVPVPPDNRDLSKFGSVHYDSRASAAPNEQRWFANQRYDNLGWVFSSVLNNPRAAGVGRITHDPIAPPFPINDSSLILSGEIVSIRTYLSNDRSGVYTEFTIKPDEVLQDNEKLGQKEIRADREGGVVIYPIGQRILYQSSTLALPELNGRYLFFLAKKGESPNYEILASYDIGEQQVYRLELVGESGNKPEETSRSRFLEVVRNKIAQSRGVK